MYIKVYVTESEKEILSKLAEKKHTSLSQLVYSRLLPLLHDELADMAAFDSLEADPDAAMDKTYVRLCFKPWKDTRLRRPCATGSYGQDSRLPQGDCCGHRKETAFAHASPQSGKRRMLSGPAIGRTWTI